nr:MAG TPA: hypothetical protein [Caudoviricetes sp.]DAZ33737.1 MAG TPA: hypothetical protein [Caudoviricetes sp.]
MESIFLVSREGGLFVVPQNRIGDIMFFAAGDKR